MKRNRIEDMTGWRRHALRLFRAVFPLSLAEQERLWQDKMLERPRTADTRLELLLRYLPQQLWGERYANLPEHCILEYEDYNQFVCPYWLRLYPRGNRVVAIATDLTVRLSRGATVTNAIDRVARAICERFRIRGRDLILVEHQDHRESWKDYLNEGEYFHFVELRFYGKTGRFAGPQWVKLCKSQVEALIGASLTDWSIEAAEPMRYYWPSEIVVPYGTSGAGHVIRTG